VAVETIDPALGWIHRDGLAHEGRTVVVIRIGSKRGEDDVRRTEDMDRRSALHRVWHVCRGLPC
jgi:hypothetical protein